MAKDGVAVKLYVHAGRTKAKDTAERMAKANFKLF